jgi:peptide/nickel transport system ATP-binding protein/oligopeptide transport system ATP-binding protein
MSAPLLLVDDLSVRIRGTTLVDGISFQVDPGEMLGLVGESGSGKSLTLRAIMRLLPREAATGGAVLWQGEDLPRLSEAAMRRVRGRAIAMVFQEPMTALNPVLPIGLQITESLSQNLSLRGAAARARAVELLDLVGIPDAKRRLDNFPHEFSGGMRQRAMIAIALAPQPKLLLADEPTTALDVTIQDQILKLLLRLKDELAMSVVLVTHDLGIVAGTCDRVCVLYAGRMMETGPVRAIFRAPAHAYTLGLIRSVPDRRHARKHLASIQGAPPDPRALPPGCRFSPRCDFSVPGCDAAPPPMAEIGAGHGSACLRAADVMGSAAAEAA